MWGYTLRPCPWPAGPIKSPLLPTDLSRSHCVLNYQSDSWDTGKRWRGNTCSNFDRIFWFQRNGNCCFFRQTGSMRIVTYNEMKNSDPFSVTSAILFITVQRQNKKTTHQKPLSYKTNPFKPSIQKWTEKCIHEIWISCIHETVQSNQQDLCISWWKCEWCFLREKKVHNGAATGVLSGFQFVAIRLLKCSERIFRVLACLIECSECFLASWCSVAECFFFSILFFSC